MPNSPALIEHNASKWVLVCRISTFFPCNKVCLLHPPKNPAHVSNEKEKKMFLSSLRGWIECRCAHLPIVSIWDHFCSSCVSHCQKHPELTYLAGIMARKMHLRLQFVYIFLSVGFDDKLYLVPLGLILFAYKKLSIAHC